MVWNSFGWWFKPYFKRISDQGALETSRQRVGHGTLFRECEWLYGQLLAIDLRERGKTVPITPDDVDKFLADESKLPR
jgi:hypothetical protein